MPEISRFFGIIIAMYHNDHPPPHFHAKYAEFTAKIDIESGDMIEGKLPKRALALIEEWRALRVEELKANWELVRARRKANKIKPLE
jgi:hypothetical protein